MKFPYGQLAYCTNIHPAETWSETREVLRGHVTAVRRRLRDTLAPSWDGGAFAVGLRLSARAAAELETEPGAISWLRDWLAEESCYLCSINGFPYGDFHGRRVKEAVFAPDWTDPARTDYTQRLFRILAALGEQRGQLSVSTVPGSHKSFRADEVAMIKQLAAMADWLDALAEQTGVDMHLGLEPEPLGHIENTAETLKFFERLHDAGDFERIRRRIGVNYDTCHFAIEFDDAAASLEALHAAGIRISKIHLSNAMELDPHDPRALAVLRRFDEPRYFHQVVVRSHEIGLQRYADLPDFFAAQAVGRVPMDSLARVHFHIPLDGAAIAPLEDTRRQVIDTLDWCRAHPGCCDHYEIETYTWDVLPEPLAGRSVVDQIVAEYLWVLGCG